MTIEKTQPFLPEKLSDTTHLKLENSTFKHSADFLNMARAVIGYTIEDIGPPEPTRAVFDAYLFNFDRSSHINFLANSYYFYIDTNDLTSARKVYEEYCDNLRLERARVIVTLEVTGSSLVSLKSLYDYLEKVALKLSLHKSFYNFQIKTHLPITKRSSIDDYFFMISRFVFD